MNRQKILVPLLFLIVAVAARRRDKTLMIRNARIHQCVGGYISAETGECEGGEYVQANFLNVCYRPLATAAISGDYICFNKDQNDQNIFLNVPYKGGHATCESSQGQGKGRHSFTIVMRVTEFREKCQEVANRARYRYYPQRNFVPSEDSRIKCDRGKKIVCTLSENVRVKLDSAFCNY